MSFLQNNANTKIIVLFIVMIFFGIQLTYLKADTPTFLSASQGIYADEGNKTLDARNMVLFGNAHWTEHDEYPGWKKRSAVTVFYNYVLFNIFGISLSVARFGNLLFSIGVLLLFYLILEKLYDRKHALLGLFLLAINKMFFFYSRLALFEVSMNFFILLGIYCALHLKEHRIYIVPAIVSFIAAYYCKPLALFFSATPVLYYLLAIHKEGVLIKIMLSPKGLLATSLVLLGCFLVFEYISIAHTDLYYYHIWSRRTLQSPSYILLSLLTHHFITRNPVLFSLSILYSGFLIFAVRDSLSYKKEDVFFVIWLFTGMIAVLLFAYHPARYFYFLVFPLIILAVRGMLSLPFIWEVLLENKYPLMKGSVFVMSCYYLIMHTTVLSINPVSVSSRWINSAIIPFAISSCAVILSLMALYGFLIKRKTLSNISSVLLDWKFTGMIIIVMFALQFIPTTMWALNPKYELIGIWEKIESLDDNAIIVGDWAPVMVVNTKNKVLWTTGDSVIGSKRNLENLHKIRPDYLIVRKGDPLKIYLTFDLKYPGVIRPDPVMDLSYAGRSFNVYELNFEKYEYKETDGS